MNGWVLALEVVCFFIVLLFVLVILKDQTPTIRFDAALREVRKKQKVTVELIMNHVKNLSTFQFDLVFDPEILRTAKVIRKRVLQNRAGDETAMIDSAVSPGPANGTLTVMGTIENDRPADNGDCVLARFEFIPFRTGRSKLEIHNLQIRSADGRVIQPDRVYDAEIVVKPDNQENINRAEQ